MPVDSLMDMSQRACSKISKRITDIGGMPYRVARPFLLKIESPEQLRTIEENCEQIIGHDAEIWRALIKRDIPNWQTKKHEPHDPKNWWKVYRKLKQESVMEMDAGADKLRAALNDKNEKQLAEIKPMMAASRSRGSSFQQRVAYGYQSGKTGSKGSSKMGVLEKIRKEAREIRNARAMADQQQKKKIATTVTRAPSQFVEAVKAQQQRSQPSPEKPIRAPRPPMAIRRPDTSAGPAFNGFSNAPTSRPKATFQEREARLKALTSGNPLPPSTARAPSPRESLSRKDVPTVSVESPSTTVTEPTIPYAPALKSNSPPSARKLLGEAFNRAGSNDDRRSASPQITPLVRKRKKEPDLFMAPLKRKTVGLGGIAAVRE